MGYKVITDLSFSHFRAKYTHKRKTLKSKIESELVLKFNIASLQNGYAFQESLPGRSRRR